MLPPLPPSRTVRESFQSHGSHVSNALVGSPGRGCGDYVLLGIELRDCLAVVFYVIINAGPCDAALLKHQFAVGKICGVGWVVRVGICSDLGVSDDAGSRREAEPVPGCWLSLTGFDLAEEAPPTVLECAEVFICDPLSVLVGVPSSSPPPEALEDGSVDLLKGSLAAGVLVIVDPSLYFRVEEQYQVIRGCRFIAFDHGSDLFQEGMYGLLRRFSKHLAVVAAYILP